MNTLFNNSSVLVTGGTGSFGQCFVIYLLKNTSAKKVIIYSRDEHKQFEMQQKLLEFKDRIRFFIGDIRDIERLKLAFTNVDYVIHAAAMKHVSMCEYNPFEAVKTNINGTQNIACAAIECGVKKVVCLSTDKAVNPVNLYGATKLAADKIIVASNSYAGNTPTTLSVVRFGNFAGSRGSVIPAFQNLLSQSIYNLPITDKQMSRFWISLEHACQMTIQAIINSEGGEIFVPKLPSFYITDLVKAMDPKASYYITGLRDGERLTEILIGKHDTAYTLEYQDYYIIYPSERKPKNQGKTVDSDFEYRSDNNPEWMSVENIQKKLHLDL